VHPPAVAQRHHDDGGACALAEQLQLEARSVAVAAQPAADRAARAAVIARVDVVLAGVASLLVLAVSARAAGVWQGLAPPGVLRVETIRSNGAST
jgi:hypothetical protein